MDESREKDGSEKPASGPPNSGDAQREDRSRPSDSQREPTPCDVCGVPALVWRKCKLVCENCGAINRTCADL